MRHIGKNKTTEARYVVASMSITGDPEFALVIEADALPLRYQDALMNVVNSNSGQSAEKLLELLGMRRFPDGSVMAQTLHQTGRLQKIPTADVIMTPDRSNQIQLNELNKRIRSKNAQEPMNFNEPAPERTSHIQHNQQVQASEGNKQIARQLMFEAQLIQQQAESDAKERREKAYTLDPSLRPGQSPSEEQALTSLTEQVTMTGDDNEVEDLLQGIDNIEAAAAETPAPKKTTRKPAAKKTVRKKKE